MRSPIVSPRILALVLASSALFVAGCGGDDDNPAGGGAAAIDQGTAQVQALQMVGFVDAMVGDLDEIASGDLTGIGRALPLPQSAPIERGDYCTGDPVWNPTQNAYTYVCTYTSGEGSFGYDYYIQFLAGTTPQQAPDETTTNINYSLDIDYNFLVETEGSTIDMDLVYALSMAMSGLQTSTYGVTGSGSMSGDMASTTAQGSSSYSFDMSWTMDVTVPAAGGCATGTVTVTMGDWTMIATYDGSALYAWQLQENGTVVASGSETAACTV